MVEASLMVLLATRSLARQGNRIRLIALGAAVGGRHEGWPHASCPPRSFARSDYLLGLQTALMRLLTMWSY
jgi:hypothetical protein